MNPVIKYIVLKIKINKLLIKKVIKMKNSICISKKRITLEIEINQITVLISKEKILIIEVTIWVVDNIIGTIK